MNHLHSTPQAEKLFNELKRLGVNAEYEYSDGHKHVDIAILDAQIYIEVDGMHHFLDPDQIARDFGRSHYSEIDNFHTIHIPNLIIEKYCFGVAKAISELVRKRTQKPLV
ncbi:MAG: hypothetical protein UV73_C0001G0201 [Candidatus Gottesmanbacteria bacterium GW2011_GWA2_43_14]|uniref:DUF559 domain-containing protein n=1 Tax=Candidatus Gottesmanbacteria bacterium GW2011_GWA2_43_14 TaxID=1618443 RepID=A0A0G1DLF5_9BACT|nr:MAG: hypothetical protein UV73_C0001G0201 [Candidatus Gottesmanbacteria bacterium GW2011_GWA2_43_14]